MKIKELSDVSKYFTGSVSEAKKLAAIFIRANIGFEYSPGKRNDTHAIIPSIQYKDHVLEMIKHYISKRG